MGKIADNQPLKVIKGEYFKYKCHSNDISKISEAEYYTNVIKSVEPHFFKNHVSVYRHSLNNLYFTFTLDSESPPLEISCKDRIIRIKYAAYTHVIKIKQSLPVEPVYYTFTH